MFGTVLLALGGALALFYAYARFYRWKDTAIFSRWRTDVPLAPDCEPLVGHNNAVRRAARRRLERQLEFHKKLGPVFRQTFIGPTQGVNDAIFTFNVQDVEWVMKDPWNFVKGTGGRDQLATRDFFGHGIFASDGDAWKDARKTASNIFNVRNFRDRFTIDFLEECEHLSELLSTCAKNKYVLDLQDLLYRCTMDSFCRLAMGRDVGCISAPSRIIDCTSQEDGKPYKRFTLEDQDFMVAFDSANSLTLQRGFNPFWEWTEGYDGKGPAMKKAIDVLDGFAAKVIEEKKKARAAKGAQPTEKAGDPSNPNALSSDLLDFFIGHAAEAGRDLSFKELRDIVMNFLIAGRDTTAQTLSWAFWEIAQRPEVYKKLREEAIAVCGPTGKASYEKLKDLKYATAVFNETLRIHPNVPNSQKLSLQDTVLPGTGTKVYAGQRVMWSSYVMGHSPAVWGPDCEEFKPERWFDEKGNLAKENQFKWPVFNCGPRICLGMNMATQEAVVFISTLVRRFKFNLVLENEPRKWGVWNEDPTKREGRYGFMITLDLREGVDFIVEENPAA
ncbi:cytochrome P450 [Hyaloraphidium curvatum]|nr:cytochrome P450 [Hyaloraphidium curvatum]